MKINVSRYSEDPNCATPEGLRKKLIADLLPQLGKMRVQRNECIVATYIKSGVSKGGIIIPGMTQEEDRWQGKVGLLLAHGPVAFDFEEVRERAAIERELMPKVTGKRVKPELMNATDRAKQYLGIPTIGEWVVYRTSETHEFGVSVGDSEHTLVSCRFITDDCIKMAIEDPAVIY